MEAALSDSWARGFPLESILDVTSQGNLAFEEQAIEMSKIRVMKFCADGNPDIDAIHRLIKPHTEGASPLQVPPHAFAPYNTQATVLTVQDLRCGQHSFRFLYLVECQTFGVATLLKLSFETWT
jgi:hypothetical protein